MISTVCERNGRLPRPASSCVTTTQLVIAASIVMMMVLLTSWTIAREIPLPGVHPLSEIQEIELTYLDNQEIPTATVRGRQSSNFLVPSSYRPSEPILDLLMAVDGGRSFGPCQAQRESPARPLHMKFLDVGLAPCGFAWSLRQQGKDLDGLSYDVLRIRGSTMGQLTIALADDTAHRRQDNEVLARVTGRFDLEVPLESVARRIDLRRLTQVILLVASDTDITLEECSLRSRRPESVPAPAIGFWLWDYRSAISDPDRMVASCLHHDCRRLLLQMPDLRDPDHVWTAYARLFTIANAAHIELFALDGYPEAIQDPVILADKIERLLALLGASGLPGVQLDIEPYLLPGFAEDETGFDRYLAAIDRVKAALNGHGRLSVVMPFWFTSTIHKNRPIAFTVMDRVDEVAVMSYRTDVEELAMIGEDTLRYGRLTAVPVWLAMETTRLPTEHHVVLKRESRAELADAFLNAARGTLVLTAPRQVESPTGTDKWFRIHHRFTTRPERITFAGRSRQEVRQAIDQVFSRIHASSLAGILIHDLTGYAALRE